MLGLENNEEYYKHCTEAVNLHMDETVILESKEGRRKLCAWAN